jgi:hypothetical protein
MEEAEMVTLNKWVFYMLSGTSWVGTLALVVLYLVLTNQVVIG